mmetsp:Transcript_11015/g.16719  ORF Transcript_11015/g.16719 Transcript_11015/m.16719 type:complete len:82 (+) Transcript_11015:1091-1336(+)
MVMDSTWEDGRKVKDVLGIKGIFPRWLGVSNVSHVNPANETKFINTLFHLGDSQKEHDLGIATGFPDVVMNKDEIVIPKTF